MMSSTRLASHGDTAARKPQTLMDTLLKKAVCMFNYLDFYILIK